VGYSLRRREDTVEAALRANRAEPSVELVADLAARVSAAERSTHRSSRFAFAAAAVVFVFGTFLSFGGVAYAASGSGAAAQKKAAVTSTSAAADQYGEQQVANPAEPKAPTSNVAGATASTPPKSGTLPFTGVGLGSTVLVSLTLVGFGVYLRRRESRE
jgi:hypothetical protein